MELCAYFRFLKRKKTGLDTTQQPYMLYARVVVIKKSFVGSTSRSVVAADESTREAFRVETPGVELQDMSGTAALLVCSRLPLIGWSVHPCRSLACAHGKSAAREVDDA